MTRLLERPASPAPRLEFRCCACGYGVVRQSSPPRCPMCGDAEWEELGWKPFAELPSAFIARVRYAAEDAADEPLRREAAGVGAGRVSPALF